MPQYYLTGPDGSGKTTMLLRIERELVRRGEIPVKIWLRSPKVLSRPLMLYCRLTGLTKYRTIDGVKYGKHEFYRSPFVSWLFPILQVMDFRLIWWQRSRRYKGMNLLLMDRFAIDTLADLMVDTGRYDLHLRKAGKKLMSLIPENTKTLVLDVKEEAIRRRKIDTMHDPHIAEKIKVFKILSRDLNLNRIDNNRPVDLVYNEILNEFGLGETR
jgi:thymidylate kinase